MIGAGVIGASWTALFLAHGLAVVVNDPRPDVETIVRDYIRNNLSTLKELGLPTDNLEKKLSFEADLEASVAGADLVQENGPERIEFKQDLWERIGKVVGEHALMLSSSSAKTATEQAVKLSRPERLLVGRSLQLAAFESHWSKSCPARRRARTRWMMRLHSTRRSARCRGLCAREMLVSVAEPLATGDFPGMPRPRHSRRRQSRRARRHRHQFDRPALGGGRTVPLVPSRRRRWRGSNRSSLWPGPGLNEAWKNMAPVNLDEAAAGQDHRASRGILCRAPLEQPARERDAAGAAGDHPRAQDG